jgi:2-C-methyl-D-erythritol 4-phosphate cytidylyltransferase
MPNRRKKMVSELNLIKKFAVIVAGGNGSRMKKDIPKQFLELKGLPVLMHTINAFFFYDTSIEFIIVLAEKEITRWKKLIDKYSFPVKHVVVAGGETRFHSVKNGLDKIKSDGIVFIHDGVRPLVSDKTIDKCFQTAVKKGNALPVVPPSESLRKVTGNQNKSVNRNNYFLVQTPQTFRVTLIKKAYDQDYSDKFTDDASVLESTGTKINLVEGNRENLKITYSEDLYIAETFMSIY